MIRTAIAFAIAASIGGGAFAQTAYDGGPRALYQALAEQPHETLRLGGGEIDVVFADGAPGLDRAPVMAWIKTSAEAAIAYFGHFPVARVGLLVIATEGGGIGGGTTFGFAGSAIRIHVGRSAGAETFANDWKLVHEMVHLALPRIEPQDSANWMMEGSATYIEPIARMLAGHRSEAAVWSDSLDGMPKGQPRAGDGGLDDHPDWGRSYWGGATFWLLADVGIREKTGNQKGLIDALRAVNRESGGDGAQWSEARVMEAGDKATGTHVLSDLYAQMKDKPVTIDLAGLFARLGVARKDGRVVFDEQAPEAAIRRAIVGR
jgi:predicted metalloprotease with PDZ domain